MAIRYRAAAVRVVKGCAAAKQGGELIDLVEMHCTDEENAHLLHDDANEQARRFERLLGAVVEVIDDYESRRLLAPLRQSEHAPTFLVFAFTEVEGEPGLSDLHARMCLQPELETLLWNLDDNLFEALCGRLLERIGCIGVTVTQQSQDSGVDFIARLPVAAGVDNAAPGIATFLRVVGSIAFLLYGQAKRYGPDNPVDADTVHKLVGSWQDRRNEYADNTIQQAAREALERAMYRAADPALLVIATTSTYTRAAVRRAQATGVVLLDGEQIAQLLLQLALGVELDGTDWRADADSLDAACA